MGETVTVVQVDERSLGLSLGGFMVTEETLEALGLAVASRNPVGGVVRSELAILRAAGLAVPDEPQFYRRSIPGGGGHPAAPPGYTFSPLWEIDHFCDFPSNAVSHIARAVSLGECPVNPVSIDPDFWSDHYLGTDPAVVAETVDFFDAWTTVEPDEFGNVQGHYNYHAVFHGGERALFVPAVAFAPGVFPQDDVDRKTIPASDPDEWHKERPAPGRKDEPRTPFFEKFPALAPPIRTPNIEQDRFPLEPQRDPKKDGKLDPRDPEYSQPGRRIGPHTDLDGSTNITIEIGNDLTPAEPPYQPYPEPPDTVRGRNMEKKVMARGASLALRTIGAASEIADTIGAIYDVLPKSVRDRWYRKYHKGGPAPAQYRSLGDVWWQLEAIYWNWHLIDGKAAVTNVLKNELEDWVIGRVYGQRNTSGIERLNNMAGYKPKWNDWFDEVENHIPRF